VNVQFIASVSVIAADPPMSRELYVDALGLPLEAAEGDDYFHSERIGGSKHFGVWPLRQAAAQACFGRPDWPAAHPPYRRRAWSSRSRTGPPCRQRQKSCAAKASRCYTRRARSRGGKPWPGCPSVEGADRHLLRPLATRANVTSAVTQPDHAAQPGWIMTGMAQDGFRARWGSRSSPYTA